MTGFNYLSSRSLSVLYRYPLRICGLNLHRKARSSLVGKDHFAPSTSTSDITTVASTLIVIPPAVSRIRTTTISLGPPRRFTFSNIKENPIVFPQVIRHRLNKRNKHIPTNTRSRAMSSDADYMAFLDKVNAQRDGAQQAEYSTSTSKIRTETVHTGVSVPHSLQSISANFISETDELFEPVVLKWNEAKMGIWPDAGMGGFLFLKIFFPLLFCLFSLSLFSPPPLLFYRHKKERKRELPSKGERRVVGYLTLHRIDDKTDQ
jgi:hypothetical protein